jgi:hypothetical protein
VFVAGEAEVDEPFLVEQPGCLLQQLNPPSVVFDQVVVSEEDYTNFLVLQQNLWVFAL